MTHDTPPKRVWKCAGCGLQMPGTCDCVTNVATSWEPDHMQVWKDQLRLETTSENIARDMSEGRFPERSDPQVIVIPEAERKYILASEVAALTAANAALEARVAELRDFIDDFAKAKIDALRYSPPYGSSPEDEPDPVVDAKTVWAWQADAKAALATQEAGKDGNNG